MLEMFHQFEFWSLVDVAIVAYILYHMLLLLRGTRAAQMLTGILILAIAAVFSTLVPLTTLNWIMSKFYSSFIIIVVVLFQEDIRNVLRRVGKKTFIPATEQQSSGQVLDEITRAAFNLSAAHIGAIIVIERHILLSQYINIGVALDARISSEILCSIFHPTSPIHDGAVIIQGARISAAGCFLPLTQEEGLNPNLGTRHRAGIGISQETDAVVVLVSEETGRVHVAVDGKLSLMVDAENLRLRLAKFLVIDNGGSSKNSKKPFIDVLNKNRSGRT